MNTQPLTLPELYENALRAKNVSSSDVQFIISLIRESDIDANAYRMENDSYQKLQERELWNVFEEVSQENNIKWEHHNEPER